MKTSIKLAAFVLASTFILHPSSLLAQGSLTPPGAPAPTMKTLDQLEARTPIAAAPFTISQPGSYYLTTNVSTSVSNAITIAASGVTLDLNGFTITSSVANAANGGTAILLASGLSDITIANGHIQGGVTNNGSDVYSGTGFGFGIFVSGDAPMNVLVSRVSVSGCRYYGIYLASNDSTVVESCTVRTVGSYGIIASTIKQSAAVDCGGIAISGTLVSDCRGASTGGTGVSATTAQNCYGFSNVGNPGVYALTALNCNGVNNSYGDGVNVYSTAQNCRGHSYSGNGVYAGTAQNCYGSSSSTGVYAEAAALNCYGYSSSGYGIYAYNIAIGCYGVSSTGTGMRAWIGNSCWGQGATPLSINNKYNSP